MADPDVPRPAAPVIPRPRGGRRRTVAITGMSAVTAYGRGVAALLAGVLSGRAAFAPVGRFDVAGRRVGVGALLDGDPDLAEELDRVIAEAWDTALLAGADRAGCPLLLALHGDPDTARGGRAPGAYASGVASRTGLTGPVRAYTSACVAASTAVADAASMIAHGDHDRVVVAAGYLVEPDQFALFDAGRALAVDGAVRPFSAGRRGLLLGDGVAAVVLEAAEVAAARGAPVLGELAGWGRRGDAYHVVQPRPDGAGLAGAVTAALQRAGIGPGDLRYVNAHGSGSAQSDVAEARALRTALGPDADRVPIASTKSLHGQSLEASPLVELVTTIAALRHGAVPVNAGYLGPDEDCRLSLVLDAPRPVDGGYALSVNSAFGGANTALVVRV